MNLNNITKINISNVKNIDVAKKSNLEKEDFKNIFDNTVQTDEDKKLKEACVEFESYFLNMMFKSMRKTVASNDGIFGKSNAEKIFQEMLDEQLTDKMAKTGGIGLANVMYKQLSKRK